MIQFSFDANDIARRLEERLEGRMSERVAEKIDIELHKTALKMERQAKLEAHFDTGEMRQKIRTNKKGDMHYEVEAYAQHAKHEEFGTRYREAHPFMRPAYFKYKDEAMQSIKQIMKEK